MRGSYEDPQHHNSLMLPWTRCTQFFISGLVAHLNGPLCFLVASYVKTLDVLLVSVRWNVYCSSNPYLVKNALTIHSSSCELRMVNNVADPCMS